MIDVLGNSLLLDDLFPDGPIAVGQTWQPADNVVAALVGLDAASRCDVQCTLKEVTDAWPASNWPGKSRDPSTTPPPESNSRESTASTAARAGSTGSPYSARRIAA